MADPVVLPACAVGTFRDGRRAESMRFLDAFEVLDVEQPERDVMALAWAQMPKSGKYNGLFLWTSSVNIIMLGATHTTGYPVRVRYIWDASKRTWILQTW